VVPAKTNYQAVDHMYMIRFTSHTKLSEFHDVPETFPKYAYTLVSFDDLRTRIDYTKHMSGNYTQLSIPFPNSNVGSFHRQEVTK
jgi:replication factor A1